MVDVKELASKNKDPERWLWNARSRQGWQEAESDIHDFYTYWRNSSITELGDEIEIRRVPSFRRMPRRLIVRESYKMMYENIWKRAFQKPETGVVVTGQPGIGKTYFLWYALIRLIREEQPVAFSFGDFVYLFFNRRVWVAPADIKHVLFPVENPMSCSEGDLPVLFVLIDNDVSTAEPISALYYGETVFPIQASSSYCGKWVKMRTAATWGLPLWSKAELNMAFPLQPFYSKFKEGLGTYLASSERPSKTEFKVALDVLALWKARKERRFEELSVDVNFSRVKDIEEEDGEIFTVDMTTIDGALELLLYAAVQDYGPVPRDVFQAIFYPTAAVKLLTTALNNVTYQDLKELVQSFRVDHAFHQHTILHRIITVDPVPLFATDSEFAYERFNDKWVLDFRTNRIAREVAKKLEKEKDNCLADFFELFMS